VKLDHAPKPSGSSFLPYLVLAAAVLTFHRHVLFDSNYTFPWDFRSVHVPLAKLMAESFSRREWPLWNPYMYAGMPVFANIQAASFYPPVLAVAILSPLTGVRVDAFLEWDLVFHVWIAGAFTYQLLRYLNINRTAALTGALVYALGGFFAAQAEHLGAVSGAAWLPLAWLSVLHLREGWNRVWFLLLAASLAMSILAGLPQVAVSVVASTFLLGAILWISSRWWPHELSVGTRAGVLASIVFGIVCAGLFAAVQIIPTIQLTWNSIARYRADYLDSGGGIWPPSLLTLLLPNHFNVFDPPKYWGNGDLTFTYFYCSLIGAALAIVGLLKKSSALFSILTLACGLWMLGDYTWIGKEIFIHLPVSIRIGIHPEFMMCAFLLGLAVLAGLGAEGLGQRPWLNWKWLSRDWIGGLVVVVVALDLIITNSARPMNQISRSVEPGVTQEQFDGSRELLQRLQSLSWSATPPWRIDVNDLSLLPWAVESPVTHVPSADGHDPLAPERIIQARLAFAHGYRWGSSYPIENLRSPVIDLMNTRYILSRTEINPAQLRGSSLELLTTLPGHWVYENKNVLPRFFFVPRIRVVNGMEEAEHMLHSSDFDPHGEAVVESGTGSAALTGQDLTAGSVRVRSYQSNRIELDSDAPGAGFLVASDANYPGWEALVDGRPSPMYYTDVAFRGLPLPAGRHTVVMRFIPQILYWSAAVSGCAWLIAGWILIGPKLRRKTERLESAIDGA
jgi:hypothetical protein